MMMMAMRFTELNKFLILLMFAIYFSLLSGIPNELLYFLKVIGKRATSKKHPDPYDHFRPAGETFLKGFYLKLVWSRNAIKKSKNNQQQQLLLTEIVFSPNEVFNTYVEFLENLHIDFNAFNILIQKSNSYIKV